MRWDERRLYFLHVFTYVDSIATGTRSTEDTVATMLSNPEPWLLLTGEPLLPKLTTKLLSTIASTTAGKNSTPPLDPSAAARLLASLLLVSDEPHKELTKALTLGLGPRLRELGGPELVVLLGAFAGRGMAPPGEWASSYQAALAKRLGRWGWGM